MVLQLVLAIPVLRWLIATGQVNEAEEALDNGIMLTWAVVALGIAALATILITAVWPRLWHRFTGRDSHTLAEWVGWRDVSPALLWTIAIITPFLLVTILAVVAYVFQQAEPNLQEKLFQSEGSRFLILIIAPTLVPIAEELIFRGALYNALLPTRQGLTMLQRNIIPLVLTSAVFAGVHYYSGVDTLTGMIQISVLSLYLGVLRALTGSVKASIAAHVSWNMLASVALWATTMMK
jgi:membrane protease YdiL (CAAX protease family)